MKYRSLHQAARNMAVVEDGGGSLEHYEAGGTQIWYMKPSWFRKGITGGKPNPNSLGATHTRLGSVLETDLEVIFMMMQGKVWSPNCEASEMLRKMDIGHTSMSVGDVVVVDDKIYLAAAIGFEELKIT